MRKWWTLNRYTWSGHVDREDAQEAEFRELYADMTSDGWLVQRPISSRGGVLSFVDVS